MCTVGTFGQLTGGGIAAEIVTFLKFNIKKNGEKKEKKKKSMFIQNTLSFKSLGSVFWLATNVLSLKNYNWDQ